MTRVFVLFSAACAALGAASCALAQMPPQDFLTDDHMREELGVNDFTTPSIKLILKDLADLKPLPYEKLSRPIPSQAYPNRIQLALNFGGLIADGFLVVECEQNDAIEPLGRAIISQARGLGVVEQVTRRSNSMMEWAESGNWSKIRKELSAAQTEVEDAMIALRDEEIAHLVSLGGWLRGLEIITVALSENFSTERAIKLLRLDLLDYFLDRLDTLHPSTKKLPLISRLIDQLKTVRTYLDLPHGKTLTERDVKELAELVHQLNVLITTRK